MKGALELALWAGVTAGALTIALENRGYTQSIDPNAAPNPYGMQYAHLTRPRSQSRRIGLYGVAGRRSSCGQCALEIASRLAGAAARGSIGAG